MMNMELECARCGMRTVHQVDTTGPTGRASCLRCATIDAEVARRVNAASSLPTGASKRSVASIVAMVAGGVMVLSAFLPWISIDNPFGGPISRSGVEGDNRDGWGLVGLGAVVLLSALISARSKGVRVVWAGAGVLGLLLAGFDISQVMERIALIDEDVRHLASVGAGLYLGCLSSAAAILAAFVRRT